MRALTDPFVLSAVRADPAATYVIRNRLDRTRSSGLTTAAVLCSLKRLEREGLVERAETSYVVMISWRLASLPAPPAILEDASIGEE